MDEQLAALLPPHRREPVNVLELQVFANEIALTALVAALDELHPNISQIVLRHIEAMFLNMNPPTEENLPSRLAVQAMAQRVFKGKQSLMSKPPSTE